MKNDIKLINNNIFITLDDLLINFKKNISILDNINDLYIFKSKYLGKKSLLSFLIKKLPELNVDIKYNLSRKINYIKNEIYKLYLIYKKKIIYKINSNINNNINLSLPGRRVKIGSLHPISLIILEIEEYFNKLGFEKFSSSEIENVYYNFDALNTPINHPSRNNKDTFWINKFKLLRTQTSCSQIKFAKKNKPPFKIMSYGKVYRNDKDKTHTPMFHQFEGFIVDKDINLLILKNIINNFLKNFFIENKELKIKFRPSFFPFTEPSIEIDIFNNMNKEWIEIMGCGLIHPNVLKNMNINSNKYSGIAFGIGIERLAMLRYNICDLKILFENNLRFLSQFSYMR